MNQDLINIVVQQDSATIELSQLSDSLDDYIENVSVQAINKIGALGLKAMRSTVPIWTRELADTAIQIDFAKKSQAFRTARVYIKDKPHGLNNISTVKLSEILDSGKQPGSVIGHLKRRKTTVPVEPYNVSIPERSPTEGWIEKGYNLFIDQLGRTDV